MANHELTPIDAAVEALQIAKEKEDVVTKRLIEVSFIQQNLSQNAEWILRNHGHLKTKNVGVGHGHGVYGFHYETVNYLATNPISFKGKFKGSVSLEEERTNLTELQGITILWQNDGEEKPTRLYYLSSRDPFIGPEGQELESNEQFDLLIALLEQIKTVYETSANQEKTNDKQEKTSKPIVPTVIRLPKKRIQFPPQNRILPPEDNHVV